MFKRLSFGLLLSVLAPASLSAEYLANMKIGKLLYEAEKYEAALIVFKEAYREKPTKKLEVFINKVEKKIESMNAAIEKDKSAPTSSSQPGINGRKWVLIGVDAALVFATGFAVIDQRKSAEYYQLLYNEIDDSSYEDYQLLKQEREKVESKRQTVVVLSSLTGVAVAYTLADYLFLHWAFPRDDAELTYDVVENRYAICLRF